MSSTTDWNDDNWDIISYMRGPSCIPGLKGADVLQGSEGLAKHCGGLYERNREDKRRLMDPALHARVAFWLTPKKFSLKEIKMECKSNGVPVTGNKGTLALRLAFKNIPEDVDAAKSGEYVITKCSPFKQGGKRVKTSVVMGKSSVKRNDENTANDAMGKGKKKSQRKAA